MLVKGLVALVVTLLFLKIKSLSTGLQCLQNPFIYLLIYVLIHLLVGPTHVPHMPLSLCGGQRAASSNQLTPFIMWVPGIELSSLGKCL